MRGNWLASLKKFCRLKVLLIQFFPAALSVIYLLVCEVQLRICVKKIFVESQRINDGQGGHGISAVSAISWISVLSLLNRSKSKQAYTVYVFFR